MGTRGNGRALFCAAVAIALATIAGVSTAAASAFMATTGRTTQPIGHYEFCRAHAGECETTATRASRVVLTPDLWQDLLDVNATVNRIVHDVTDEEQYGRPEVWAYPDSGRGDCEDFALLKRRTLIARGWPAGALLMTVVLRTNGEGHAVLTVLTDRGDLILDNLEGKVLLWSETDYRYVKRQSELNAGLWTGIQDDRQAVFTSATR
jgi:predicted transglutaminase-like cysteine proteinase